MDAEGHAVDGEPFGVISSDSHAAASGAAAATLELDEDELQDVFYERGWTDGLPVIPPTPERVDAMLAAADAAPGDVLGGVAPQQLVMTARHAAVNAVMAGCPPPAFPIVVAALAAALDPAFNLPVACTSTGGAAICVVVSGPAARAAAMHSTHDALGPRSRANVTIGRAVRLAATNFLGSRRRGTDGSSIGHPGKLSYCLAEDEGQVPWPPLHVELGYGPDDTSVTVLAAEAPRQVANHLNPDPEGIVATLASALRAPFHFAAGKGGAQFLVVLGPEHAGALAGGGWSRRALSEALCARSRLAPEALTSAGVVLEVGSHHDMVPGADGLLTTVASPDDVLVVTAGGAGAGWSAVVAAWAPTKHSRLCTRRVRAPGEGLPAAGPDGTTVDWD